MIRMKWPLRSLDESGTWSRSKSSSITANRCATLSPQAFHAYLPAYLVASSRPTIHSTSMAPTFAAICCSRLAAGHTSPIRIDLPRRESACPFSTRSDVVANVLRYLELEHEDAGELLRNWRAS